MLHIFIRLIWKFHSFEWLPINFLIMSSRLQHTSVYLKYFLTQLYIFLLRGPLTQIWSIRNRRHSSCFIYYQTVFIKISSYVRLFVCSMINLKLNFKPNFAFSFTAISFDRHSPDPAMDWSDTFETSRQTVWATWSLFPDKRMNKERKNTVNIYVFYRPILYQTSCSWTCLTNSVVQ